MWLDKILYIAEFNQHEFIENDNARLVVNDARLHKKLVSWSDVAQHDFMERCYEKVNSLNLPAPIKNSDSYRILEGAYQAKNLIGVAKKSYELSEDIENWQNDLIWGYINEEVMESIPIEDLA